MQYQKVNDRAEGPEDVVLPPEKKECWSYTTVHRLFRIVVLCVIIAVVVAVPIIAIRYLSTHKTVTISTDKSIKASLSACMIYIAEDANLATTQIEVELNVPGIVGASLL